jgi:hypothetical protein
MRGRSALETLRPLLGGLVNDYYPLAASRSPEPATPSGAAAERLASPSGLVMADPGGARLLPDLINQPRESAGSALDMPKTPPDEFRNTAGMAAHRGAQGG